MIKPSQYLKIKVIYILIFTTVWTLYSYGQGVMLSPDALGYSKFADNLIEYNFNYVKYLENPLPTIASPLFNLGWITIVAFIKLLCGEHWSLGIVILNLLFGVFVAILILKTTWVVTEKPVCSIFVGILLLLSHNFYRWVPWALSDIFFSCLCVSIFLLVIGLYQQPSKPLKETVWIGALVCLAFFSRPSVPPLLVFVMFSIPFFFFFGLKETDPGERHNFISRLILLACILIPVTIYCHSYFMLRPDKWPFPFLANTAIYVAGDYQLGIIVHNGYRDTYDPGFPNNTLSFALLTCKKFFAYFTIAAERYSFRHKLFNYTIFLPVYGLSIWAIASLFKKDNGPSHSNWWSIFSCALFIFLFAFFHSMHQIDGDYRYTIPVKLPLILLAALGLNELIKGFSKKT
jgi:hypothetical protein